ncbi:MAG: protein kinase, partial [Chloroflexia bacterium]|nr:protein kinase [Chloroflexia bacterium]
GETYFIAMQFVRGNDLKQKLGQQGRFAPDQAVGLIQQILGGLATIHRAGIVHRDIKPQNILCGDDGVARLTDFGIAHVAVDSGLTSHGTTIGSASYMAPEQARGGHLSEATDLYAIGVVLFELLTGRLPFEAANPMAVMLAHIQLEPPRPSDLVPAGEISPALDAVVLRALAKERSARFATTTEMAQALRLAVPEGGEVVAPRVAEPATSLDGATTAPMKTIAGAVTAVAAGRVVRPVPMAPPLPSQRRRARGWLVPLLLAFLALGGLAAFVNFAGLGPGSGDSRGGGELTRVAGVAPAGTPEPLIGVILLSTLESTSTAAGTASPTASSTATSPPTATAARAPTKAPTSSPTDTPVPEPTATSAPVETVPPAPIQDNGPPTIAPAGGGQGGADSGRVASTTSNGGESLAFAAADWTGGHYQSEGYGLPWTAIYGQSSGMSSASISFDLDSAPQRDVSLILTGLDDESSGSVPIRIEINGSEVFAGASPFPSWNGVEGSYPWAQASSSIPAQVFRAGTNTITVTNLATSGQFGFPPYLLLNEVRVDLNG